MTPRGGGGGVVTALTVNMPKRRRTGESTICDTVFLFRVKGPIKKSGVWAGHVLH